MFTELWLRYFVVTLIMTECYFLKFSSVYHISVHVTIHFFGYNSEAGKTQLKSLPSIEELKKFM